MEKISAQKQSLVQSLRRKGLSHRDISQHQKLILRSYKKSIGKFSLDEKRRISSKGGIQTHKNYIPTYSKKKLIDLIQKFVQITERIPTKREFVKYYVPVLKVFKTWNNAIKVAGFSPNPVLFAKKYIARDGHKCDSLAEKIIDDWLYARKISHLKNVRYINSRYTADFVVDNTYIEFFGLQGQLKSYDALMKKKLKLINDNNFTLISLYHEDIFPTVKLKEKLKSVL